MERYEGRVAVVTGVSSGIGEGLVRALVGAGLRVAGCARNADKLQVRRMWHDGTTAVGEARRAFASV